MQSTCLRMLIKGQHCANFLRAIVFAQSEVKVSVTPQIDEGCTAMKSRKDPSISQHYLKRGKPERVQEHCDQRPLPRRAAILSGFRTSFHFTVEIRFFLSSTTLFLTSHRTFLCGSFSSGERKRDFFFLHCRTSFIYSRNYQNFNRRV